MQKALTDVIIKDEDEEYIAKIIRETRKFRHPVSVSPRGGISNKKHR